MNVYINKKTGEIKTPGRSFGYGRQAVLTLTLRKDDYLLLHKKGTQDFGGVGCAPAYYPARFIIGKIIREENTTTEIQFKIDIIKEIETGRTRKRAFQKAINIINQKP